MSVEIIAEVGSNHSGSAEIAKLYIEAAKQAGASSVKLQTLTKEQLMSPRTLMDGKLQDYPIYQQFSCHSLSEQDHLDLAMYARDLNIPLFSAPFYLEAVDLLEKMGVEQYKVASGDIAFFPLLKRIAETGKPVILSTGCSDLKDVEAALNCLNQSGAGQVTLLHCVSNYPPQWHEVNLKAMQTMQETFKTPVGISDHSPGSLIPIAAVAMGASVIEKHVSLNTKLSGPDHPFAMNFTEFEAMVSQIRTLESALGNGNKQPSNEEQAKQWRIRRGPYDPVTKEPSDQDNAVWLRPDYRLNPSNT